MSINLSLSTLKEAIHIKEQIATLEARLKSLFGSAVSTVSEAISSVTPGKKGKRKMSAAGRAKIAAAQRARWAKTKGEATPAPVTSAAKAPKAAKVAKRKSGLSAAGRAKIIAAQKARWAKVKKAKK